MMCNIVKEEKTLSVFLLRSDKNTALKNESSMILNCQSSKHLPVLKCSLALGTPRIFALSNNNCFIFFSLAALTKNAIVKRCFEFFTTYCLFYFLKWNCIWKSFFFFKKKKIAWLVHNASITLWIPFHHFLQSFNPRRYRKKSVWK